MLPILRVNRNIRTIRRYRTILGVLIKYGFGHFVEQLNIDYYLELGKRLVTFNKMPKELERLSQPQRLRMAMEELGPTFIKLGQLLSTRPDVLGKEYIHEFSKLQDEVPAVSLEEINAQIQRELGYPGEELFAEFSKEPIAAASIAGLLEVKRAISPSKANKPAEPRADQRRYFSTIGQNVWKRW